MAYTPTEWQTGDIITATKLNNMEQGIANAGILKVSVTDANVLTLDKTWQEIFSAGFSVLTGSRIPTCIYMGGYIEQGEYVVTYWSYGFQEPQLFITDSPSGYPVLEQN